MRAGQTREAGSETSTASAPGTGGEGRLANMVDLKTPWRPMTIDMIRTDGLPRTERSISHRVSRAMRSRCQPPAVAAISRGKRQG